MARSVRKARLETRTARLKLPVARKPLFIRIGPGLSLGYRRNQIAGTWVLRLADGKGGATTKAIGTADDYEDAKAPRYWTIGRRRNEQNRLREALTGRAR
jgi:hypothetical protein